MEASTVRAEGTERANELYWGSERSVNQIADDLDLSKGALYDLIEPLAAGGGCPLCGSHVVYRNRTAEERDLLDCSTCDWDGSADETVSYEKPEDEPESSETVRYGPESSIAPPAPASVTNARLRTMAGGALLGAAVGLALVIWARRR